MRTVRKKGGKKAQNEVITADEIVVLNCPLSERRGKKRKK